MLLTFQRASILAVFLAAVAFAFQAIRGSVLTSSQLRAPESFKMDTAILNISNALDVNLSVWYQTDDCFSCPFLYSQLVPPMNSSLMHVQTNFISQLMISFVNTSGFNRTICRKAYSFHEAGSYELNVSPCNNSDLGPNPLSPMCGIVSQSDGTDFLIPMYICLGLIVLFFLLRAGIYMAKEHDFWHRMKAGSQVEYVAQQDLGSVDSNINQSDSLAIHNRSQSPSQHQSQQQGAQAASQKGGRRPGRLRCLDTFRGLSLVVMIFVNYGGGGYWFFEHSTWNGLTVADLVFPWFVFIMGTAIGYTMRRGLRRGSGKRGAFLSVCRRAGILFLLGVFLSSRDVPLDQLRFPGVLQRLAVAYFFVASVEIALVNVDKPETECYRVIEEQTHLVGHWVIFLAMPLAHTLITFLLPVPGCPTGYLGPGGIHDNGAHSNCTGGAAGYIDRLIIGDSHIYNTPTCRVTYQTTVPYDPEGLLGCLTSTFMCYLGFVAGRIFAHFRGAENYRAVVARLIFWGILTGSIAAGLCGLSRDTGVIPVNKNLWSMSFILALSGMAYLLLAALFLINDCTGRHGDDEPLWSGSPFHYPGSNSILVYLGHELFQSYLPVMWLPPKSWAPGTRHAYLMPLHLWGACFWTLVAWLLHRKKIFFTV